MNPVDVEMIIAEEACRHAEAVAALNPYSEAEWIAIGNTRCIYAGASSPVFGVYAFQEENWEEREWRELERFFSLKERPASFWVTAFTPKESLERIEKTHRCTKVETIYGTELSPEQTSTTPLSPIPLPDLDRWSLLFSRRENPAATEASYLSAVKLHQKETRFYENGGEASYTFFSQGFAYVPYPSASLRDWQIQQAQEFRAKFFLERKSATALPLLTRNLYEPI
jgi:hypothetical protein